MKMQPIAPSLLPLPVESPASIDPEALSAVSSSLGLEAVEGVAVLVTSRVDVVTESGVPLLAILSGYGAESVSFYRRASVLVTNPSTRTTLVGRWSEWDEPDPDDEPPPARSARQTHTVLSYSADLREQVPDLPWIPSTLRLQVLLGGWSSPAARVTLSGAPYLNDPQVVEFLQARAVSMEPPPHEASPAMWLPSDPASLQPPAEGGLLALLPPVAFAEGEEPIALDLAFYVSLLPHELLDAAERAPADSEGRALGARVSLSIVVTGEELIDPVVLRVYAPAYVLGDANAVRWGWGRLTLDLNALPSMPRIPDRYWVRVVAGEYESEAMPLTLVPTNLRVVRPKVD